MKKRIFSFLLAVCMMLFAFPTAAFAAETAGGTCGENLTWSLSGGTLTISGTGEMDNYGEEYDSENDCYFETPAPWESQKSSITEIVLKEGVTSIGEAAFAQCENLKSVTIPASVVNTGFGVFEDSDHIENVYISDVAAWCAMGIGPDSNPLKNGGKLYLNGSLVTDLIIPAGVSEIQRDAFLGCSSIESVTIPASVGFIGFGAFGNCENLKAMHISDIAAWCEAESYGEAWQAGMDLYLNGKPVTDLVIPTGVDSIGDSMFSGFRNISSVTFPQNVDIGWYAFEGCANLKSVTFSDGDSIGWGAFWNCDSLENVTIPAGVEEMSYQMFSSCDNLQGIWVDEKNPNYSNDAFGVLFNKDKTELIEMPGGFSGAYTIPESIIEIDESVFGDCHKLTSLTILASLERIDGFGLFTDCSGLEGIWVDADNPNYASDARGVLFTKDKSGLLRAPAKISGDYAVPKSVGGIDVYAFAACENLQNVMIPEGVGYIDGCAFLDCKNLQSVTIPSTLTFINSHAFEGCDSLARVEISDIAAWCKIRKNYNPLETGAELYLNGQMPTEIMISTDVESLGWKDFSSCDALNRVTIAADLEWIASYAFEGCSNLKTVEFKGNAPLKIYEDVFLNVAAMVYYPCGNETWTEEIMQNYGGNLTWKPRHHYVGGVCDDCGEAPAAMPGDYTGDGVITNEDVAYLLWYTLFPEDYPVSGDADFDGDGAVSNEDVCYLLWHTLFPEDYPV